jgi:hypothetical protein
MRDGYSLRSALLQESLSSETFYKWLDEDELKAKQYARACEERADKIVDEMLDIADDVEHDTIKTDTGERPDNEWISRSRLKVDTRKWLVSKLNPKKYGDKMDLTSDGEKLQSVSLITMPDVLK